MKTPDVISPWFPEPDLVVHQALGKVCEEANELAGIAARCLIQGLNGSQPVTGKANRDAIMDEIEDVQAAIDWLREVAQLHDDPDRRARKLSGFVRWQKLLEGSL